MKRTQTVVLLLVLAIASFALGRASARWAHTPPGVHAIAFDAKLDTLDDEDGADAYNHTLDHADSRYYVINDYYNMTSGGSLHILPHFETYQQTTEYSCGSAVSLMLLRYYGNPAYNEMVLCDLLGTDENTGTPVEGIVRFFDSLGWKTFYHAGTDFYFQTIEECEDFFLATLDSGKPILVDWVDWVGHWQVLIGMDTCGTDDVYDDVLIMADPYDVTDHYQDGYYIVPFGRFFEMWHEGPGAGKAEPYQQTFVIAVPPTAGKIG